MNRAVRPRSVASDTVGNVSKPAHGDLLQAPKSDSVRKTNTMDLGRKIPDKVFGEQKAAGNTGLVTYITSSTRSLFATWRRSPRVRYETLIKNVNRIKMCIRDSYSPFSLFASCLHKINQCPVPYHVNSQTVLPSTCFPYFYWLLSTIFSNLNCS